MMHNGIKILEIWIWIYYQGLFWSKYEIYPINQIIWNVLWKHLWINNATPQKVFNSLCDAKGHCAQYMRPLSKYGLGSKTSISLLSLTTKAAKWILQKNSLCLSSGDELFNLVKFTITV
jgi:hypothetical protein